MKGHFGHHTCYRTRSPSSQKLVHNDVGIRRRRRGFQLLELLFMIAVVALVLQFVTLTGWRELLAYLDVRTWNSRTWFGANAGLFLTMFLVRFGPIFLKEWRRALTKRRAVRATSTEDNQRRHSLTAAEERALYNRIIEARKKQII